MERKGALSFEPKAFKVGLGLKASVAHLVSTQISVECPNHSTFGLEYRDDISNIWVKSSWHRPKKRRV